MLSHLCIFHVFLPLSRPAFHAFSNLPNTNSSFRLNCGCHFLSPVHQCLGRCFSCWFLSLPWILYPSMNHFFSLMYYKLLKGYSFLIVSLIPNTSTGLYRHSIGFCGAIHLIFNCIYNLVWPDYELYHYYKL